MSQRNSTFVLLKVDSNTGIVSNGQLSIQIVYAIFDEDGSPLTQGQATSNVYIEGSDNEGNVREKVQDAVQNSAGEVDLGQVNFLGSWV